MPIHIIAIGKKHEPWVQAGIERYEIRLRKPFTVSWTLLPHSSQQGAAARHEESKYILEHITANDFAVLLDERGVMVDSPHVSKLLLQPLEASKNVVLVIGGAYGVDEAVHNRAQFVWSLSALVFPHQLVRLLLIEQLYRAQEIAAGRPYHHM